MLPPLFLGTASLNSKLLDLLSVTPAISTGIGVANRAFYTPITIPYLYPMKRMWIFNQATIAGNVDLGLYSRDGARVVSTGSFAQSGASAMQYANLPYLIPPGAYYLALAFSSTGTVVRQILASTAGDRYGRQAGLLQQDSAFPLPAVMIPATYAPTGFYFYGITLTESGF